MQFVALEQGFYAYLYFVAIGFFGYIYILLKTQFNFSLTWKKRKLTSFAVSSLLGSWVKRHSDPGWFQMVQRIKAKKCAKMEAGNDDVFQSDGLTMEDIMTTRLRVTLGKELDPRRSANHGSFYLRMGAVGTFQLTRKLRSFR